MPGRPCVGFSRTMFLASCWAISNKKTRKSQSMFLPIVAITFLVGIVRHYVSVLLSSAKKVDLNQVKDR